jgi:hypothetical protein
VNYVKIDFLNWNADVREDEHDGLIEAQNVLHQAEGWLPIRRPTASAFSTTSSLNETSITAVQVKPFGNAGELGAAVIAKETTTTSSLKIGVIGVAPFTTVTLGTMASLGAASLTAFTVSELGQNVVIAAEAEITNTAGAQTKYNVCGTFTYTITSV